MGSGFFFFVGPLEVMLVGELGELRGLTPPAPRREAESKVKPEPPAFATGVASGVALAPRVASEDPKGLDDGNGSE